MKLRPPISTRTATRFPDTTLFRSFDQDREALQRALRYRGMPEPQVRAQLENSDNYDFFVPEEARWNPRGPDGGPVYRTVVKKGADGRDVEERLLLGISHQKTTVGSYLNKDRKSTRLNSSH